VGTAHFTVENKLARGRKLKVERLELLRGHCRTQGWDSRQPLKLAELASRPTTAKRRRASSGRRSRSRSAASGAGGW
jgi:hypothetical protein